MSGKLLLIDGHSIAHRAYYGVPPLTNSKGFHTNAIYGFLNILFRLLDEEQPDYLIVAFDEHAKTFRHERFAEYKGTRKPMDPELREQIPVLKELLCAMGIRVISRPGLEADDIMGTLAKMGQKEGMEVCLVSGDRDLLQIADEHIQICIPKTKGGQTNLERYYPADVEALYQVTPLQFIQLKALMGDSSDNIPGAPGVGEKTAIKLMTTYGSIDGIYEHIEEISGKALKANLSENRELVDLSLFLATIKIDCAIDPDWETAKAEGFYTPEAFEIVKTLEFKNLLGRFDLSVVAVKETREVKTIVYEEYSDFLKSMEKYSAGEMSLSVSMEDGAIYGAAIGVMDASGEEQIHYLPVYALTENAITDGIRAVSKMAKRICVIDSKPLYRMLDWDCVDSYFDNLLAAYLLNPLKSDYDMPSIALEVCNLTYPSKKEVLGKMTMAEAAICAPEKVQDMTVAEARVALESASYLEEKLTETGMLKLFREVEMPLALVLYDMERKGVCVQRNELREYGERLSGRISQLEENIYEAAGLQFNLNSPKQLGEILFERMGLPGGKKTKTGYSTSAEVLEKLAESVPFVRDILEYRTLAKLKSTYAEGLSAYIGADERIHGHFNQTVTATGRISSSDPNLQNIPIRTELGRELRKVFVPSPGRVLVDADYSQIELRLLASMSGDEQLIDAYRSHQDIHKSTASKVFHIPFDEVTEQQRRNAKAVNFGIVYGISSFGLSQGLSIDRKEAAKYIEQYFETYPGIKTYLDGLVKEAKEKGYITTLFGRRRPIPELTSSNFMQRSFGERVAMNSPLQGTAADIMKIAMIGVWKELRNRHMESELILQVHDEIIIDTVLSERDDVCELVERNMRNAADLSVTLEVGIDSGSDWYEAH